VGSCFLAWVMNETVKGKEGREEDGEGEERVVMLPGAGKWRGLDDGYEIRSDQIVCPSPGFRLNAITGYAKHHATSPTYRE